MRKRCFSRRKWHNFACHYFLSELISLFSALSRLQRGRAFCCADPLSAKAGGIPYIQFKLAFPAKVCRVYVSTSVSLWRKAIQCPGDQPRRIHLSPNHIRSSKCLNFIKSKKPGRTFAAGTSYSWPLHLKSGHLLGSHIPAYTRGVCASAAVSCVRRNPAALWRPGGL